MGRKQPWCGKHLYFHPASGVKIVILLLVVSCGSLLWADLSMGETASDWQLVTQCVGTKAMPVPAEKALQCMTDLKGQWPADSAEAQVVLLLGTLLETNVELKLELSKKKEIIRILIEQIERIKMIDLEMEKRRKGNQQ